MYGFKEIEHSGDVGLAIEGANLKDLFRNAALGLFGLLVRGGVSGREMRSIRAEANSYDDLLVNWLSEIIAISQANAELYSDTRIDSLGDYYVEGILKGEPYDPSQHDLRFEVKAATYHDIYISKEGGIFKVRVIFDL